jgi:ribonuclease R
MDKIKEDEFYNGQIEFSKSGNASIIINEKQVFIHRKRTLNSLHLDGVRVQTFKGEKKIEAKVVEVVSRFKTEFVGKVQKNKKTTFVVTDNSKIFVDFYIKGGLASEDGQKVIVQLIKWEDTKSPQGKIIKILGDAGDNNAEMNSIMHEYGLPVDFPQEVINESELIPEVISEKEISKRKDMRGVTTIGIDPFDSKDADDTISLEVRDGFNWISINIADVSHYVKEDSLIDKEAYRRGNSVYLIDRCIPMLPHRLSNEICSLKSGRDRLCVTVAFKINDDGKVLDTWIGRTVINVDRDYSYEEAQNVIENGINIESERTDSVVLVLDRIAKIIRKERMSDGSLEMSDIEVKFKLSDDGKPIGIYTKVQKDSNKLIEEFMLLANREVARFLKSKEIPYINRVHGKPDDSKLIEVKKIADSFGWDLKIDDPDTIKKEINKLLNNIKDTPECNIITTLIIRSQKKAIYSTDTETGHYGLGFSGGEYAHFTSPIRRYSDLIIHRILGNYIR